MRTSTIKIIAALLGLGIVLIALILGTERRGSAPANEVGPLAYLRGPHDGRLLSDGPLQLEMTMYEDGVPPRLHVYPFDADLSPLPPDQVHLTVELRRLGGRVDTLAFAPTGDFLRGDPYVEEPHSFEVTVIAHYQGTTHRFEYAQIEGKVQLGDAQRAAAGIILDTVGPRRMMTTLELPGEVRANDTRRAHVVARLPGVVTAVLKQEGDRVRQGDLLAVLSSRELADAKAEFLTATRHLDFLRATLTREASLWQKKISVEREFLTAKRDFEEAELQARLAGQKLVVLGVHADSLVTLADAPAGSLARHELRAPLDGTVTARRVTVGEAVSADQPLFEVTDLSTVWVDVAVYAADLGAVGQGQEASIRSSDLGREVSGRISYLGPMVGGATRTATARIVVANPDGRWRPGLFVTVRVVREAATVALAVPLAAIQTFRDWQVVFVRYGDWFEARPLTLGRSDGEWIEVLSGLVAGVEYARVNSFAIKAEIGKLGATHDH